MTTTDIGTGTGRNTGRQPRPRRGRTWRLLHAGLTTVLAVTAAGLGYGWYREDQWRPVTDPAGLADTTCTVAADTLLTVTFSHGPGEVVSTRFSPHKGGVLFRFSSEYVESGDHAAIATSSSVSTTFPTGLGDRPVFLADGTRLNCRAVELPPQRKPRGAAGETASHTAQPANPGDVAHLDRLDDAADEGTGGPEVTTVSCTAMAREFGRWRHPTGFVRTRSDLPAEQVRPPTH